MRVDCHTHIGPFPEDKRAEELITMLDDFGIDKALALPGKGLRGSPKVYAENNDYIATAAQKYPGRLVPICTVNPWHGDEALAELERAVRQLGCMGLKLHPPAQGFDVYDLGVMAPLMERVADLGIFVIIHGGIREHDNPLRFVLLSQRYRQVKLVMLHANFGGSDRVAARWAAESTQNLYFETSATNEPAYLRQLNRWSGGGRIFYGSDWPWLPPRLEMAMVQYSGLDMEDQDALMGKNAARVLLNVEV
jgi:uncharacterized protein